MSATRLSLVTTMCATSAGLLFVQIAIVMAPVEVS